MKDGYGPCTHRGAYNRQTDTYTCNKFPDVPVRYCDCNETCKYYWEELDDDYDWKDHWC